MSEHEYEFEVTLDGRDLLVYGTVRAPNGFSWTLDAPPGYEDPEPEVWFHVHEGDPLIALPWLPASWGTRLTERLWDEVQAKCEKYEERMASEGRGR